MECLLANYPLYSDFVAKYFLYYSIDPFLQVVGAIIVQNVERGKKVQISKQNAILGGTMHQTILIPTSSREELYFNSTDVLLWRVGDINLIPFAGIDIIHRADIII